MGEKIPFKIPGEILLILLFQKGVGRGKLEDMASQFFCILVIVSWPSALNSFDVLLFVQYFLQNQTTTGMFSLI